MADGQTARDDVLEEVFRMHYGRMVGYVSAQLRAWDIPRAWVDPEDIVQVVYQRVWVTPDRPDTVRVLRAYVYRALIHESSRVAKLYRHTDSFEAIDQECSAADLAQVPDHSDAIADRAELQQALGALPPQQRTAVVFNKAMDFTQEETARAMGKSPGTVATHVARAMTTLKVTLGALGVFWCCLTVAWCRAIVQNIEASTGGHAPHTPPAPGTGLGVWVLGITLIMLALAGLLVVLPLLVRVPQLALPLLSRLPELPAAVQRAVFGLIRRALLRQALLWVREKPWVADGPLRVRPGGGKPGDDEKVAWSRDAHLSGQGVDSVLDEIDAVLEENREDFVRNMAQTGGE